MDLLLEPLNYSYMRNALWASALVGGVCAFLSCYLMLKGWSLIGDALSHSVVPGVAGAYMLGLPYSLGALIAGGLAAFSMLFITDRSPLKTDAVIGLIFTGFFGLGLFMVSLSPTSVNIQTIVFGNILAISPFDMAQLLVISLLTLVALCLFWKDLVVVFFDESHARSIGLSINGLKVMFFTLLSTSIVVALQTVGAFLVVAMVVTPGATAYLLTDRFPILIIISVCIGVISSLIGIYASYFIDGASGGMVVLVQTALFLLAFFFSPTHGLLANKRKANRRLQDQVLGINA
ncbi:MAG: metal ABC transporter permease [Gammaproteobacteria bacterium]|nr:metal ABC transporter permease [Gammaproteobacteria bacterium]